MNRILLVSLAGAGGLLSLAFLAYIFWPSAPVAAPKTNIYAGQTKVVTVGQTYVKNPATRYSSPDTDPNKPQPTSKMSLQLATGKGIVVHDIMHDRTTMTDPTVPNRYFLTGGLDPVANDYMYSLYYSSVDQRFTIVLLQEPFQTTRTEAEQDLVRKLGIDQETACMLKYEVVVPSWASAQFSKQNLGLSFCPGAVLLSQ